MFGVWKNRFPALRHGLRMLLPYTRDAIVATAILHNIATVRHSLPWMVVGGGGGDQPDNGGDEDSDSDSDDNALRMTRYARREAGKERRNNVVEAFFR